MLKRWLIRIALAMTVTVAVLVVLAVGSLTLIAYAVNDLPVNSDLESEVRRLVHHDRDLEPLLARATADGRLTMAEANAIISAAEKKRKQ